MVLLIDNYDSFTYNIYQYLCELGATVEVVRNDMITIPEIENNLPDKMVISPGPGTPDTAGVSVELVRHFSGRFPILGVCLGHQCIGQAFGAVVSHAGEIMHGKTSLIHHDNRGVFLGLPQPLSVIRYHSLAVKTEALPECLEISSLTENGIIMGLRHLHFPVEGVQFHPESILTGYGKDLLKNFLAMGNTR